MSPAQQTSHRPSIRRKQVPGVPAFHEDDPTRLQDLMGNAAFKKALQHRLADDTPRENPRDGTKRGRVKRGFIPRTRLAPEPRATPTPAPTAPTPTPVPPEPEPTWQPVEGDLTETAPVEATAEDTTTAEEGSSSWWNEILQGLTTLGTDLADLLGLGPQDPLEAFLRRSFAPLEYQAPTGHGGFLATYDPNTGRLDATVRIGCDFQDVNPDASWADFCEEGGHGTPWSAQTWTDEEKASWTTVAIGQAEQMWGDAWILQSTRTELAALPPVHVQVHVVPSPLETAHVAVQVFKIPDPWGYRDNMRNLYEDSADAEGVTEPDMITRTTGRTIGITGDPNAYEDLNRLLPLSIDFPMGAWALTPQDTALLGQLQAALVAPGVGFQLRIGAGADGGDGQASGEAPKEVARQRVQSIEAHLQGVRTWTHTYSLSTEAPSIRCSRIDTPDNVYQQSTWLHEFGHMLGLPDEYPDVGKNRHRPLGAPIQGLPEYTIDGQTPDPVIATQGESMMSCGSDIRPYHYAIFADALGRITGMPGEWTISSSLPIATP